CRSLSGEAVRAFLLPSQRLGPQNYADGGENGAVFPPEAQHRLRKKNWLLPRQWMALPHQLSMLSSVATLSASTPRSEAIAAAISSVGKQSVGATASDSAREVI